MFVTKILLELDAELERLQTARNTIASLIAPSPTRRKSASPLAVVAAREEAPPLVDAVQEAVAEAEAPATAVPARRRGRPKGSVNRRPAFTRTGPRTRAPQPPEPTALARLTATGPVFVSAAELERHRNRTVVMAAPKPAEDVVSTLSEGTLESLIREVAERRTAAAA